MSLKCEELVEDMRLKASLWPAGGMLNKVSRFYISPLAALLQSVFKVARYQVQEMGQIKGKMYGYVTVCYTVQKCHPLQSYSG